jgi:hypothetical protein
MKTPRGGGVSPRPGASTISLQEYQRVRFEGLAIHGALTQEVIQTILSLLKNATIAGQTRVRVQTLHLARDYAYSRHQQPDGSALVIHDMLTFRPYKGTTTRLHLASRARELMEWLVGEQKVRVIAATCCMSGEPIFGEPTFASFMHLYAILIPEKQSIPPTVWNATFVRRTQDVQHWNDKLLAALRVGASYANVCVLYWLSDYGAMVDPTQIPELECTTPRHHLTMEPLKKEGWALTAGCSTLVAWVAQAGYKWTLVMDNHSITEKPEYSLWAYFCVLLMPLDAI